MAVISLLLRSIDRLVRRIYTIMENKRKGLRRLYNYKKGMNVDGLCCRYCSFSLIEVWRLGQKKEGKTVYSKTNRLRVGELTLTPVPNTIN